MTCDEVKINLIDLVEGLLSSENVRSMEEHLRSCASCSEDAAHIRSAMAALPFIEETEVPNGYFQNFVPRLREHIGQRKSFLSFGLPSWAMRSFQPMAALSVMAAMAVLFRVLQPAGHTVRVADIFGDSFRDTELIEAAITATPALHDVSSSESSLFASNEITDVTRNFLNVHASALVSDDEQTIESIVDGLPDDDVNAVITKMSHHLPQ